MRFSFSMVVFVTSLASGALSDARYTSDARQPLPYRGIALAQSDFGSIAESDMRRLVFYAGRALDALKGVISSSTDSDIAVQNKNNELFRSAISRLVDASARSGVSNEQLADFFTQFIVENEGPEFGAQLGQIGGGLDFLTLFQDTSSVDTPNATIASGEDFLDALAAASESLLLDDSGNAAAAPSDAPVVEIRPVALENANAEERAVVERIKVENGAWTITVIVGDSLALFSAAIYGNTGSFTTIFDANRDVMTNPNVLEVDTVLKLPKP